MTTSKINHQLPAPGAEDGLRNISPQNIPPKLHTKKKEQKFILNMVDPINYVVSPFRLSIEVKPYEFG